MNAIENMVSVSFYVKLPSECKGKDLSWQVQNTGEKQKEICSDLTFILRDNMDEKQIKTDNR